MRKVEINCKTGETKFITLSSEEEAQIEQERVEGAVRQAEMEAKEVRDRKINAEMQRMAEAELIRRGELEAQ